MPLGGLALIENTRRRLQEDRRMVRADASKRIGARYAPTPHRGSAHGTRRRLKEDRRSRVERRRLKEDRCSWDHHEVGAPHARPRDSSRRASRKGRGTARRREKHRVEAVEPPKRGSEITLDEPRKGAFVRARVRRAPTPLRGSVHGRGGEPRADASRRIGAWLGVHARVGRGHWGCGA